MEHDSREELLRHKSLLMRVVQKDRGQSLESLQYGYENNGISCVQCRLGRDLPPYQVAS